MHHPSCFMGLTLPTLYPSILEYEPDLQTHIADIRKSESYGKIQATIAAGVRALHIDVMRKPYTEESRFSQSLISRIISEFLIAGSPGFSLDFHLMTDQPDRLFPVFLQVPSHYARRVTITVHAEAYLGNIPKEQRLAMAAEPKAQQAYAGARVKVLDIVRRIKKANFQAGIALEPSTPLSYVHDGCLFDSDYHVDMILLMSVITGKGGQKFQAEVLKKIQKTKRPGDLPMDSIFPIEIDGGVTSKNLEQVLKARADIVVVGSHITRSADPAAEVRNLLAMMEPYTARR